MFASEATRSSVANRVTYSAYSRFATSKPSEQKTAATSAVRHTMRRLGRNLKMMKNSATPSAKEIISRLKRHNQSIAKLLDLAMVLGTGEIEQLRDGPRTPLVGVEHLVECGAQAAEQARREPQEQRQAHGGQPDALAHHARERALHQREGPVGRAARGGREQPGEQLVQLDLLRRDLMLGEGSDRC